MLENNFDRLTDTQKSMFVELCKYAAMANDRLDPEEMNAIDAWCAEMRIENQSYQTETSLETVLSELNTCDRVTKKMLFAEILSILAVDGEFSEEESVFSEKIYTALGISKHDAEEMTSLWIGIMNGYNALNQLVRA